MSRNKLKLTYSIFGDQIKVRAPEELIRRVFYPQKESLPSSYSASCNLYDLSTPHSLAVSHPTPLSNFSSLSMSRLLSSPLGTPLDGLAIFSLTHKKIFP